jgi:Ser/Thr protein kinase RdoA (MazF antagonist)
VAPPTHVVHIDRNRGVVTKRFLSWDRGEPEREWTALTLLVDHAPGLAPRPIRAELDADPPVIEMSCLPGTPLGRPLSSLQAAALAATLGRLWTAVPATTLSARPLNSTAFVAQVGRSLTVHDVPNVEALARQAFQEGTEWFARTQFDGLDEAAIVLGQGDPNLANFLWDGADIRIVDFEDSGTSSRAFELAILVEHVSTWSEASLDCEAFLAMFDLTAAELATLHVFRKLAAMFWLLKLQSRSDTSHPDRDNALKRQAERLLTLLA